MCYLSSEKSSGEAQVGVNPEIGLKKEEAVTFPYRKYL